MGGGAVAGRDQVWTSCEHWGRDLTGEKSSPILLVPDRSLARPDGWSSMCANGRLSNPPPRCLPRDRTQSRKETARRARVSRGVVLFGLPLSGMAQEKSLGRKSLGARAQLSGFRALSRTERHAPPRAYPTSRFVPVLSMRRSKSRGLTLPRASRRAGLIRDLQPGTAPEMMESRSDEPLLAPQERFARAPK